jgi:hypothetical protein
VTKDDVIALIGIDISRISGYVGGDLKFQEVLSIVKCGLSEKSTDLDAIDGKPVTVLYRDQQYLILDGGDKICQVLANGWDSCYIDTAENWDLETLKQLPKGTIGRWLHPDIESELWRLEAIAETEHKEQRAEREKADRLAQFEKLKAEFGE